MHGSEKNKPIHAFLCQLHGANGSIFLSESVPNLQLDLSLNKQIVIFRSYLIFYLVYSHSGLLTVHAYKPKSPLSHAHAYKLTDISHCIKRLCKKLHIGYYFGECFLISQIHALIYSHAHSGLPWNHIFTYMMLFALGPWSVLLKLIIYKKYAILALYAYRYRPDIWRHTHADLPYEVTHI